MVMGGVERGESSGSFWVSAEAQVPYLRDNSQNLHTSKSFCSNYYITSKQFVLCPSDLGFLLSQTDCNS